MINGMKEFIKCIFLINWMKPSAVTCVGIIMIPRINVNINFFNLNSYAWIAYAVIVEKYVLSNAVKAATITLLSRPERIGMLLLCNKLFTFFRAFVLGRALKPFVRSACERVEFTNNT